MNTDILLDHMANPRNTGKLPDATGYSIQMSASGDALRIAVRMDGDRFDDLRFASFGEPALAGVASYVTDSLKGHEVSVLSQLTAERLCAVLGLVGQEADYARRVLLAVLEAVQDHRRRRRLEEVR
jgi:NifU-like protein